MASEQCTIDPKCGEFQVSNESCCNLQTPNIECCDNNWKDIHGRTCEMLENADDGEPKFVGCDGSLAAYRCKQFCRESKSCENKPEKSSCISYTKPQTSCNQSKTIDDIDWENQFSDHSCKTFIRETGFCDSRNDINKQIITNCTECV